MKICPVALNIVPYFLKKGDSTSGGAEVQTAILADAFQPAGAGVELVAVDLAEGETPPFAARNAYFARRGIPGLRFFHPRLTRAIASSKHVSPHSSGPDNTALFSNVCWNTSRAAAASSPSTTSWTGSKAARNHPAGRWRSPSTTVTATCSRRPPRAVGFRRTGHRIRDHRLRDEG